MAQKKLLFVLVSFFCFSLNCFWAINAFASDELRWAKALRDEGATMNLNHLRKKLGEGSVYGEDVIGELGEINKNYQLKIFVSSSMPISLLKVYAAKVSKYGGTLVFKGLPGGNFKSLLQIVMEIEGKEGVVGSNMQIDQEAFEAYSVLIVPTIVLARDKDCYVEATCKQAFDKITGNVGVEYALQKFSQDGELKDLAIEILAK